MNLKCITAYTKSATHIHSGARERTHMHTPSTEQHRICILHWIIHCRFVFYRDGIFTMNNPTEQIKALTFWRERMCFFFTTGEERWNINIKGITFGSNISFALNIWQCSDCNTETSIAHIHSTQLKSSIISILVCVHIVCRLYHCMHRYQSVKGDVSVFSVYFWFLYIFIVKQTKWKTEHYCIFQLIFKYNIRY